MAVFQCKMCGGDLTLTPGSNLAVCQYCGSQQTVPAIDDDKKARLYNPEPTGTGWNANSTKPTMLMKTL